MVAQRPTGVLVFAILHLLFGVTGVISIVATEVVVLTGGVDADNPLLKAIPRDAVYITLTVCDLLLKLLLAITGVALLRMITVARVASIAYAMLAILLSIAKAWLMYRPLVASLVDPESQDAGWLISLITVGVMVGFSSIYPLANLIYFSMRSVKEAFRD